MWYSKRLIHIMVFYLIVLMFRLFYPMDVWSRDGIHDVVVLKDKRLIEGVIVSDSGASIDISAKQLVVKLPKSGVERIDWDSAYPRSTRFRNLYVQSQKSSLNDFYSMFLTTDHGSLNTEEIKACTTLEERVIEQYIQDVIGANERIGKIREAIEINSRLHDLRYRLIDLLIAGGNLAEAILAHADLICEFPSEAYQKDKSIFVDRCLLYARNGQIPSDLQKYPNISPLKILFLAAMLKGCPSSENLTPEEWTSSWRPMFSSLAGHLHSSNLSDLPIDQIVPAAIVANMISPYCGDVGSQSDSLKAIFSQVSHADPDIVFDKTLHDDSHYNILSIYSASLLRRQLFASIEEQNFNRGVIALKKLSALTTGTGNITALQELKFDSSSSILQGKSSEMHKAWGEPESVLILHAVTRYDWRGIKSGEDFRLFAISKAYVGSQDRAELGRLLSGECNKRISDIRNRFIHGEDPSSIRKSIANLRLLIPDSQLAKDISASLDSLAVSVEKESIVKMGLESDEEGWKQTSSIIDDLRQSATPDWAGITKRVDDYASSLSARAHFYKGTLCEGGFNNILSAVSHTRQVVREEAQKSIREARAKQERERKQQEEEEQQKKEHEKSQILEMRHEAINNIVLGFLNGQPKYERIIKYWDPKSKESPIEIYRLVEKTIGEIHDFNDESSEVTVHLHFYNKDDVEFNAFYKIRVVKREARWYVEGIFEDKGMHIGRNK